MQQLREWFFAQPYLLLTLVPLFWGGNAVVGRGMTEFISPITLAWIRWTVAFLLIFPFALPSVRRDWQTIRSSWKMLLLLSLFLNLLFFVFFILLFMLLVFHFFGRFFLFFFFLVRFLNKTPW